MSNILLLLTILAMSKTNVELIRGVGLDALFKKKCPSKYEVIKDKIFILSKRIQNIVNYGFDNENG